MNSYWIMMRSFHIPLNSATSASIIWFCRHVSFSTCGPVEFCHCSVLYFGGAESHGIHATPHVAIGGRSHNIGQFEVKLIPATLQALARSWAQRPSPPWPHRCCPRRWQLPGSCLPTRASQPPLAPAVKPVNLKETHLHQQRWLLHVE
jgi:hypothetical protein